MNNKKTFQKISGELAWNIILQTQVSRHFNMMVTPQSLNSNQSTSIYCHKPNMLRNQCSTHHRKSLLNFLKTKEKKQVQDKTKDAKSSSSIFHQLKSKQQQRQKP